MRSSPRPSAGAGHRSPRRPAVPDVTGAPFALPRVLDDLSDRWWGLTPRARTVLAVVVATSLVSGAGLRAAASPYGPPVSVLVAGDDLAAGTELDAATLRAERWPEDLVPPGAVADRTGTLTAPLPRGAVLTDRHVTDDGLGGLVASGHSAVPLPAELVSDLPVGTRVQVLAGGTDGTGTVLAGDAEVVSADGASLWLAVPDDVAADVAAAGLRGSVALAVRSRTSGGPGAGTGTDPDDVT